MGSIDSGDSIIPLVTELNSISPVYVNPELLKRTLTELYKISDGDILVSWYKKIGYESVLLDVFNEIRPSYYDKISKRNLSIVKKVFHLCCEQLEVMQIS